MKTKLRSLRMISLACVYLLLLSFFMTFLAGCGSTSKTEGGNGNASNGNASSTGGNTGSNTPVAMPEVTEKVGGC